MLRASLWAKVPLQSVWKSSLGWSSTGSELKHSTQENLVGSSFWFQHKVFGGAISMTLNEMTKPESKLFQFKLPVETF